MPAPELHRGKIARHPRVLAVAPLTRDELACLRTSGGRVISRVKAFRDTHHRLARLLASGMRTEDVVTATGYSPQRITTLRQDPAFQQLIEEYRGKVEQAWIDSLDEFHRTSTSNMLRAERHLEEHFDLLDETGDLMPINTILKITSDRADRFGYGKHSTETKEIHDFAKIMEEAARRRGRSNVIDASPASSSEAVVVPSSHQPEPPPPNTGFAAVGFRRQISGR